MIDKSKYAKVIDISDKLENYSQRNNKLDPYDSCNTTCYTMACSYIPSLWNVFRNSIQFKKYSKLYLQEEDSLRKYILDQNYDPTIHAQLCAGFNEFMNGGKTENPRIYSEFRTDVPIITILNELINNRPVIISGNVTDYRDKEFGHLMVLVGCAWSNENNLDTHPDIMIIDDPYGNINNKYNPSLNNSGKNVPISWDVFINIMKPARDKYIKWAHMFRGSRND